MTDTGLHTEHCLLPNGVEPPHQLFPVLRLSLLERLEEPESWDQLRVHLGNLVRVGSEVLLVEQLKMCAS